MYPILTCPDLDEAITLYEALSFRRTLRQVRPYAYAVVQREDMAVHLSAVDGFDPATSVGSVIVVVPDVEALHRSFAAGLRERYGRLPTSGAPRLLRPRRKQGTATGFSVVDTGGNWLRVYALGSTDEADGDAPDGGGRTTGLARVLEVAARQGDARGDEAQALAVLEAGLARHPDAPAVDVVRVLAYRVELHLRRGEHAAALAAYDEARAIALHDGDAALVADELDHAGELLEG